MVRPNKSLKKIVLPPRARSILLLESKRNKEVFKLDSNEAVIPPSPGVIRALKKFLDSKNNLNWYPDPEATELRKSLARYVKLKPEEILPTNGSEQGLEFISNSYLAEGDEVIMPTPTFSPFAAWPISRGAKMVEIPYNIYTGPFLLDIQRKVTRRTKIIYLVNPYITTYQKKDIAELARRNPNAFVIVDEAYYEYYGRTAVGLIKRFPNVIVTRTLSKTFMLAGLRLGFVAARKEVIANLKPIIGLYNVNVLTHVAGMAALRDVRHTHAYAREVRAATNLLAVQLLRLGFDVVPTEAGLVLFKHNRLAPQVVQKKLESKNIYVRYPFFKELPQYLRMNVGTVGFTRRLLARFEGLFG